jgi:peptide/nickel transport system permease protein
MHSPAKALWIGGVLAAVHLAVLCAGFVAPYPYDEQHREFPYAPPSRIHFEGLRPEVFGLIGEGSGYREVPGRRYPIRFFHQGRLFGVDKPGTVFLLGTDGFGRDVLSRVLYGGRISLFTGLLAACIALFLGTFVGTLSGFSGGWVDQVLMRLAELVMALPWLYLLLAVRAMLPLRIEPIQAFLLLIAIIGAVGWVRPARLVRGVVLSARERGFVVAARGFGASKLYLIRRHVLPQTAGVVLTQATILIPQYILAEVTLSFLGLGVGEPVPSWGNMLAEARQYHSLVYHLWLLSPGLTLIPVLLGYLALSDTILDLKH